MPKTSKDILAIIASCDIGCVDLDDYLSPNIGQVVYNSEVSILNSIFSWTKKHKIERLPLSVNLNLSNPIDEVNESMLNFCDKVCFFWNETEDDVLKAIKYAEKLELKYVVHIIKER